MGVGPGRCGTPCARRRTAGAGQIGVGGAVVVAVGVLLGWLAGRRSGLPPVRATGVSENLPRTADAAPPPAD